MGHTSRIVLVRAYSCVSPHRQDSGMIRSRNNGGQGRETDDRSEHNCSYLCGVCVGGGSAYWNMAQCLYYTSYCCVSSIVLIYVPLYVNTPTTVWANETFQCTNIKLWKNTMIGSHSTYCHVCLIPRSSPPMFVTL